MALIVTAMSFALRGGAMGFWTDEFALTNAQVGWVTGTAFWGFTLAMMFGGPLCDIIGLKRIALIAFFGHVVSILLTVFAWNFWSLYLGTLIFGIANGSVEAACNPLIATLYKDNKTTKLNNFHVWFPGGIVIGAVLALCDGTFWTGLENAVCWYCWHHRLFTDGSFFGSNSLKPKECNKAFPQVICLKHASIRCFSSWSHACS